MEKYVSQVCFDILGTASKAVAEEVTNLCQPFGSSDAARWQDTLCCRGLMLLGWLSTQQPLRSQLQARAKQALANVLGLQGNKTAASALPNFAWKVRLTTATAGGPGARRWHDRRGGWQVAHRGW